MPRPIRLVPERRMLLATGGGALLAVMATQAADISAREAGLMGLAIPLAVESAMRAWGGGRSWQAGGLELRVPEIVDNGLDVPLSVRLVSPEPPGVRVLRMSIWAPSNPEPLVLEAEFDPMGVAMPELSTRIRLATSQTLQALVEFSDGRMARVERPVLVALAACIEG